MELVWKPAARIKSFILRSTTAALIRFQHDATDAAKGLSGVL